MARNIRKYRSVFIFGFLLLTYFFLYKIYIPKINAFGCADDCFNFVGGYFIGRGRQLYSQIFFNHMPLMPYLSAAIQHVGKPINIFALVLQHRQFLFVFSFIFNVLIVWRFGMVGLAYMLVYEFSKFYVFGDRFLGEAFIVYPLVYLTGLGLHTILKKRVYAWEIIFAAICTWFIVFVREPYVPVALLLFAVIMRPVYSKRIGVISLAVFLVLTAGLFTLFPIRDFVYNVVNVNLQRSEVQPGNFLGTGIIKSFFYPAYLLFAGKWNDFRIQLLLLSAAFWFSVFVWVKTKKNPLLLGFLFVALGLANLRPTIPGLLFYEAYHEINWYGMFVFSTMYLLYISMQAIHKTYIYFIISGLVVAFVLTSPRSFIYQHVDEHTEFLTNYGTFLQVGEVIKAVSTPHETLFANGADEFLYVVSDRNSAYPPVFYYPSQDRRLYAAGIKMYRTNPPDIIYDFCSPDAPLHPYIPAQMVPMYSQWYSEGKPTCLYMKKSLVPGLSPAQRAKAMEFLYYLPDK